jgi:DNA-binding PadR family transcriptional regulator
VTDTRHGNRRIYQLHPEGVAALRDYLDRFWGTALSRFAEASRPREEPHDA